VGNGAVRFSVPELESDIVTRGVLLNRELESVIVKRGPSLWSSGQSSWLQTQRSPFDSRRYQIFCEVVGLERGPLSLVMITEKPLHCKSRDSGLENLD
jgi:hypothetical protein